MSRNRFERRLARRRRTDRALAEADELRRTLGETLEALDALQDAWTEAVRPGPEAERVSALVDERRQAARALLQRGAAAPADRQVDAEVSPGSPDG